MSYSSDSAIEAEQIRVDGGLAEIEEMLQDVDYWRFRGINGQFQCDDEPVYCGLDMGACRDHPMCDAFEYNFKLVSHLPIFKGLKKRIGTCNVGKGLCGGVMKIVMIMIGRVKCLLTLLSNVISYGNNNLKVEGNLKN